ncbi:response regulator [Longitalea arenae]|uniref:response regulator n=1 Tax=Longitalea arenae TaxID=2812558 RepID=UPI0019689836|nr:response regulator [Longitalea arenae]
MLEPKIIMLIDDDQDDRFLVSTVINSIDPAMIIREAKDGRKAIEFLNQAKIFGDLPALIILDFNMPTMNGLETYKEIKKDLELSAIPIVILSTHLNNSDADFWKNESIATFTKPANFTEFENCIKSILAYCATPLADKALK